MANNINLNLALNNALKKHNADVCPSCGRQIQLCDISWNNGATEAGTECCVIYIVCMACKKEINYIESWYPGITNEAELIEIIDRDWNEKR